MKSLSTDGRTYVRTYGGQIISPPFWGLKNNTCVSGQRARQFQPCASTFFFFQFNSFATVEHILSMVHIRKDLTCIQPIEVAYYSADSFPAVCCHCASGEDLLSGPESKDFYPICHTCRAVSSTHPILKRKRKLTR